MTQTKRLVGGGDVSAIPAAGPPVIPYESNLGCLLASGTTYYFPVGDADSTYESIHVKWDAAVIVTFTLWESNFPRNLGGMGAGATGTGVPTDESDYDNGAGARGNWIQLNPTAAVISTTSDDASTGGATVTGATIAVAGGTAGGAMIDIGNIGSRRLRLRAVVGATGGKVRVVTSGKE